MRMHTAPRHAFTLFHKKAELAYLQNDVHILVPASSEKLICGENSHDCIEADVTWAAG